MNKNIYLLLITMIARHILYSHLLFVIIQILFANYFFEIPLHISLFNLFVNGSVGYWTHRLGHNKKFGQWYFAHSVGHHRKAYPLTAFASDKYILNPGDKYNLNTFIYIFSVGSSIILTSQLTGYRFFVAIQMFILIQIENLLHNELHLTNSKLGKYSWYKIMKDYHMIHHLPKGEQNFMIFALEFDYIFGTFVEPTIDMMNKAYTLQNHLIIHKKKSDTFEFTKHVE